MENKEPPKKTNLSKSDNNDSDTGLLNDSFTQVDDSNAPTTSTQANSSSSVPNSADLSSTPISTNDDSPNETLPEKDQSKAILAESTTSKIPFSVDYILNALSTKHVPDIKSSQNDQHQQNDLDKKHPLDASNRAENSCGAASTIVVPSNLPVASFEKNMLPEKKEQISSTGKLGEFIEKLQNPSSSIQVCET